MIRVQGPREQDFYYRLEPKSSYQVIFRNEQGTISKHEFDYEPSRAEIEKLFYSLYSGAVLI